MKTRIIAVAVAAVLALVGAVVLVMAVRSADQAATAGAQLTSVLVVRTEVPAGTAADHLGDAVETRQVPARYVAAGAISDLAEIDGLVAAVNLQPGEQILAARFSSPQQLASAGIHAAVPDGMQEVSIAVDLQRIAGGSVGPGDRVGVFASFDRDATKQASGSAITTLMLNQVLVTSIASTVDPGSDQQQAQGLVLVTLALTAEDAQAVVFAAEFGHIWMSAQNDSTTVPTASPDGSIGASK